MFANEPGQIRFTEDFHEQTRGSLLPDHPIHVEFADARIPDEPTGSARLEGRVRFDGGPILTVPLQLRSSWRNIDPGLTESGEGNYWVATIAPPSGSRAMCIWFVKTGPSGRQYYDSHFGENYWFRFTPNDLNVVDATLDEHGFRVVIEASSDVTSIEAHYLILNRGLASGVAPLKLTGVTDLGMEQWIGVAPLDPKAVVSFVVFYTAGGRTYRDDNQRRNYLAPDPDAVLTARRAAQLAATPNS
jgi:hypothetical protein